VAQFAVIRPLQLLNLSRLSQLHLHPAADLFDPENKKLFQRYAFLRELSRRLVRPVMPESEEHNYLITQVIADYLAMHPRMPLAGIIYPSVQRGTDANSATGENVVLFHKAARAVAANAASCTAEAQLYEYGDDDDPRASVRSLRPTILYTQAEPQLPRFYRSSRNRPAPGLKLIRDSIEIHHILAVDIKTDRVPVRVG
jgi:hypothetical protein